MNEGETAAQIASALFGGKKADDEPSQPKATEPQPRAEPSEGANQPEQPNTEDPAAQHNALVSDLFKGSEAKQAADRKFFSAPGFRVEPPDEGA